jgi:carbohydrate kinase (thermoresistant glucokinase family)
MTAVVAVLLVLMGVEGSGKSTVGPRAATELGVPFYDADDYHDAAAKAQMAAGVPLDDATRRPWLERLHGLLVERAGAGCVLACSALKPSYRTVLAADLPDTVFVALVAPPEVLAERLIARHGHFAGRNLLASQLATFELDGGVRVVDADRPIDRVVADVVAAAREVAG